MAPAGASRATPPCAGQTASDTNRPSSAPDSSSPATPPASSSASRANRSLATAASMNGAGAILRPNSSAARVRSPRPAPPPPRASGTAMEGSPIASMSDQSRASNPSGSLALTRSVVDSLAKKLARCLRRVDCSSESERSMSS